MKGRNLYSSSLEFFVDVTLGANLSWRGIISVNNNLIFGVSISMLVDEFLYGFFH